MTIHYFNYSTYIAERGWEYRRFCQKWWQIYKRDKRWVPPHHRQLHLMRNPQRDHHLARTSLAYIHLEAFPQRRGNAVTAGALWEEVVAASMLAVDPRQHNGTGLLTFFHCANDEESLDRLLGVAFEELSHHGGYRLVGPTGPSPHLTSGALENYFHVTPPLHTPYNPPYLAETLALSLKPWQHLALYAINVADSQSTNSIAGGPSATANVEIIPLTASQALSESFLPLWQAAVLPESLFPAPDQVEASFLWHWITVWPWAGWVVLAEKTPVAFVLLQPDLAEPSRVANGGRNPLWAWWLRWRSQRPVTAGRVVFGTILPTWRGQGLEELLWDKMIDHAHRQGWQTVTIGPLLADTKNEAFLQPAYLLQKGAVAQQQYTIYASEL